MKKYRVRVMVDEVYEIVAEDEEDAGEKALEQFEDDVMWKTAEVVEIEEIGEVKEKSSGGEYEEGF